MDDGTFPERNVENSLELDDPFSKPLLRRKLSCNAMTMFQWKFVNDRDETGPIWD
jgi:hypothetical protein